MGGWIHRNGCADSVPHVVPTALTAAEGGKKHVRGGTFRVLTVANDMAVNLRRDDVRGTPRGCLLYRQARAAVTRS